MFVLLVITTIPVCLPCFSYFKLSKKALSVFLCKLVNAITQG